MKFIFCSGPVLAPWDWKTSLGGSERWCVMMCQALARRGHEIFNYAPMGWTPDDWVEVDGVKWKDISQLDPTIQGIWIIQRDPAIIKQLRPYASSRFEGKKVFFYCHDYEYSGKNWALEFDTVLVGSEVHKRVLSASQPGAGIEVVGAGFDGKSLAQTPHLDRNPRRIIYTSNPSRGLINLLMIFRRLREDVPDVELVVTHGWEVVDAMIRSGSRALQKLKDRALRLLDTPGVIWKGRLADIESVWTEYAQAGIFCYPTAFPETFCVALCEAQALGCIPVVSAIMAVGDNLLHGVRIPGNPDNDRLVRVRFVRELEGLTKQPETQERLRPAMMREARARFDFERAVSRLEAVARSHTPVEVAAG